MSSKIEIRKNVWGRPSWQHNRPDNKEWPGMDNAQLEMLESIRNAVEDVRASQMMQCDVAHAIKEIARTLKRIDQRLAKVKELKLR